MLWGRVQTLYLKHPKSVRQTISGVDGYSINVISMVDFWMEGVDQRTFGPCAAAPLLTNQTVSSS